MDWKTMETAPKDGTVFLAWNGENAFSIFWSGRAWDLAVGGFDFDIDNEPPAPTHWMDLPEPPEKERAGNKTVERGVERTETD